MTKKQLKKARAALEKCGGNCKNCSRLEFQSKYINPSAGGIGYGATCYYFTCTLLNGDSGSDTARGVYADAIDYINFELERG